ncbi:CKLF-like MARVEL transmembrane domain-containing protein 6 [Engraulis encrasicolus]|uniref:CKLF-like MARVEL transmembrane domain-containing protein 6 n=1 Tax=Engraulis encrasicolus TaxID=184585 RepID=UPI002FCFF370
MADSPYQGTTTPASRKSGTVGRLTFPEVFLKSAQLLFSVIAFILEEIVTTCNACGFLYFFEFISCTAFLFTLLLTILLASKLHSKVGINRWETLDFGYTFVIAILFILASVLFLSNNNGSEIEKVSGIFGIIAAVFFFANAAFLLATKRSKVLFCLGDTKKPTVQAEEGEKLQNGA